MLRVWEFIMKRCFLLAVILILSLSGLAAAQQGAQQFEGFNLQGYRDDGEKQWDVKGDTADIVGNQVQITNVDANQYGEQDVNLKARTGLIDKSTGNIHLEKDVVITSEKGAQLNTNSIDWQKDKDLVTTEDVVQLTDKGMKTVGRGLTAQPGLKTAKLKEDITITVESKAEEGLTPDKAVITCDGPMEIDQKNSLAVLNENVVAMQTDRTLKADKMEIFLDPATQKIKKMICTGNVEILQGGSQSFAQKAEYNADTQKVLLSGRPKIIMITEGEGSLKPKADKKE
jgi:LPS export ABC transporter protein LptC/lipopolysaccharide transport protein LptA